MCNYITRSLRYATPLTEQMYSSWSHNAASYTTLFHGNQLDDLTTTGASVGLVFAIFGIPSAHHCYHNAVHVEPGLTQRCRVGRAQTALQHVEKGLTHRLQNTQEKKKEKKKVFTAHSLMKLLWQSCAIRCWSYGKWLRSDSHCLMLLPEVEQKVLQGVKVIQVADGRVDHKHHLRPRPQEKQRAIATVHKRNFNVSVYLWWLMRWTELTLVTCSRNSGLARRSCVESQFVP